MASVHDVASKIPRGTGPSTEWKVPLLNALRFRANIYITGPPAFHEDNWAKARIGDTPYRVIDAGSKKACLGMQITPLADGHVKVGDVVDVLETGEHFFQAGEGDNVKG
jgi:uncharacterized protein YcbX